MPTLRVTGLDELRAELERLRDATDPRGGARDTMDLAVGMLHRYAAGIVAVDEGRLMNSLFTDVYTRGNSLFGLVATNVEYAIPVERRPAPAGGGRGGSYFARTVAEEGPNVNSLFGAAIMGR